MGETLLDRAKFNLEMALFTLKKLDDGDERVLNVVGYQLQQAVELFLKHFLETESTGFPFSHDIDLLLDLVESANTSAVLTADIKKIAGTLTLWEAKTRYVKNYTASRRSIFMAVKAAEELFKANGCLGNSEHLAAGALKKLDNF